MNTKGAAEDFKHLEWYLNRSAHGRGRICGANRRLLKNGYLKILWTGHYDYVLSLSDKGRAKAKGEA